MTRLEEVLDTINVLCEESKIPTLTEVGKQLHLTKERVRQILKDNDLNILDYKLQFKNSRGYRFGIESDEQIVKKYLLNNQIQNLTIDDILTKITRELKIQYPRGKLYKNLLKLGINYKSKFH